MATIVKARRLFNPGRKRKRYARRNPKKRMTLLQKLHFGSKAQRASAAKSLKGNRGRRRRKNVTYVRRVKKGQYLYKNPRRRKKRSNVSSIITVWPKGNPSKRRRRKKNRSKKIVIVNKGGKRMARARRRRNKSYRRRKNYSRRRRNVGVRRYRRRRSNPVVHRRRHYRRRKGNPVGRRRYGRSRNPGMLSGTMGRIAGVIGGIAVTKLLYSFVPSTFTSGVLSYLSIGVIAFAQGKLVGKISKNSGLGEDFLVGGFAYLVAKMLNDFFPSVGSYTGISGMGLIGGSSFYLPQVNQPGSMGTFQVPAAVSMALPAAVAAPTQSLGRIRRSGRVM